MENINEHDMTKRMLDKIREGNKNIPMNENVQYTQPTQSVENLDEHDRTKRMLETIREGGQPKIQGGSTKMMLDEREIGKKMRKLISEGETDNTNHGGNIVEVGDDDISEVKVALKDVVGMVDMKLYQVNRELENVILIAVIKDAGNIEFKFDNGKILNIRLIKDPGSILIGQTGSFYRHNYFPSTKDRNAWFQWIEKFSTLNSPAPTNRSNAERLNTMSKTINEITTGVESIVKERDELKKQLQIEKQKSFTLHEWSKGDEIEDLKTHEIVLIVLDSDIVTTGFITYDKLWKLGSNKELYKGGITINNVAKWRKIDLE